MIKARTDYILISADYSGQEVKVLAEACGDENMHKAIMEGKDIYSSIAAKSFNLEYRECVEFFPEGSYIKQNEDGTWRYGTEDDYDKVADGINDEYKEGKARRSQAKVILLGIIYSRGPKALAEQLGCDMEEAKDIINTVFTSYPKILEFANSKKEFARKNGYVTTLWGRKRRLPDIQLPPYEFDYSGAKERYSEYDRKKFEKKVVAELEKNYWDMDKRKIIIKNVKERTGIGIKMNGGFIAQAERQVVNSIIQGCLAGEMEIETKLLGKVAIADVAESYQEVWDGKEWSWCYIADTGYKIKCALKVKGYDEIVCSPAHKFLVEYRGNREWWSFNRIYTYMRVEPFSKFPVKVVATHPDDIVSKEVEWAKMYDLVEIPMYDVYNTKNGYYQVNGLLTHNSSADMTKNAIIALHNNEELKNLGFKLIAAIHDELIAMCPVQNVKRCVKLFTHIMGHASDDKLHIPITVDLVVSHEWYGDEIKIGD